ncbi:hypothetical protein P5V15_008474 [Pogonomyrmex californicus]
METWNRYYNIVYKISSLTGTWPYLKPRTRIFRVFLLTLTMLTIVIPQIAYQYMCKRNDVQCIFESMTSYLLTVVAALKVYTFQLNTRTIKSFTQHLYVDWEGLKTPEEYEIMKTYAENSRRFCLIYLVYCLVAVFTFMSMSFIPFILDVIWPLNESRPILPPYPGYYFVDTREYFFKIFCHSVIGWEIIMAGIVAHDCMFVTYVEHVCSMFAMAGFHFENLFCYHDEEMEITEKSNNTFFRKKISFFVRAHREALKFAELLEDTFTMPFAVEMLIATIGISITLLQITQQNGDILESVRYVLYIIGQLIHLFFLSFEGQKLIDHSVQTCDKIYNSTWYEVSVTSQKLIVLVMMKSVRPSFLSAGKIYIFSLESFTTVTRAELSRMLLWSFLNETRRSCFEGSANFDVVLYGARVLSVDRVVSASDDITRAHPSREQYTCLILPLIPLVITSFLIFLQLYTCTLVQLPLQLYTSVNHSVHAPQICMNNMHKKRINYMEL